MQNLPDYLHYFIIQKKTLKVKKSIYFMTVHCRLWSDLSNYCARNVYNCNVSFAYLHLQTELFMHNLHLTFNYTKEQ